MELCLSWLRSPDLADLIQLGDLSTQSIAGYGGELIDRQLNHYWSEVEVTVPVDDGPDVALSLRLLEVITIDTSDSDLPELDSELIYLAKAKNGDAYQVDVDDALVVQGLFGV